MNPRAFSLLYIRRRRADHRVPLRREDEEPLQFMVSNSTYRLVMIVMRMLMRLGLIHDHSADLATARTSKPRLHWRH